jgi:hypothetical protein
MEVSSTLRTPKSFILCSHLIQTTSLTSTILIVQEKNLFLRFTVKKEKREWKITFLLSD